MNAPTEAQRRIDLDQALANTRIEGHVPTPEFLADVEAVATGKLTPEQARAASLARALGNDKAATERGQ